MSEPDESSAGDPPGSGQFRALYLAPFSAGFGLATLITLLPKFADTLDASGTTTGLFWTGWVADHEFPEGRRETRTATQRTRRQSRQRTHRRTRRP